MRCIASTVRPVPVMVNSMPPSIGLRHGISLERDLVHVDEMLAQGFKVDLGPVGFWVSLQDTDNLLDSAKGILARHRGRGGVPGSGCPAPFGLRIICICSVDIALPIGWLRAN